jgi:hypothetical protein
MTSGNVFPIALLVLFLATGGHSFRTTTPRVDLHVVLASLSDAFENSLPLRRFAEDARSSLLRFASQSEDHVCTVTAALLDEATDVVDRDFAWCSRLRRTVTGRPACSKFGHTQRR